MGQKQRFYGGGRLLRALNVHGCPDLQGRCSAFSRCVVRGGAGGQVDASAWARRASQWRTMRAGPRASADSVLDVRLAGTGPSAHRVDSGPNGLRALLPM